MSVPAPEQQSTMAGPAGRLRETTTPRAYWFLFAATAVLLALPILTTHWLPLIDLPNHIARDYILFNYQSVQEFQDRFRIEAYPLPNLAMDLIVVPLQYFLTSLTATRIFVLLSVLLFLAGCHAAEGSIKGRHTYWAPFCSTFVYTSAFFFGFVNYVFGLGLFLLVFARYLRWRKNLTIARAAELSLLSLLLYVAHLTSAGFLGVSVGFVALWDFYRARAWKPLILSGLAFVPVLLLLIDYKLRYNTLTSDAGPAYVGWMEKVNVAASLIRTFSLRIDYVVAVLFLTAFATVAAKSRGVRFNFPIVVIGCLFGLLTLVSPFVYATSYYFDLRFLLPCFVLFVLALDVELPGRSTAVVAVMLVIISVTRIATVWREWRVMDEETTAVVATLDQLPKGCHIATRQFLANDPHSRSTRMVYSHAIHYATVTRNCTVETLFAIPGQQPLLPRAKYDPVRNSIQGKYKPLPVPEDEFVMTFAPPPGLDAYLQENANELARRGHYALWKMRHPATAAAVTSRN